MTKVAKQNNGIKTRSIIRNKLAVEPLSRDLVSLSFRYLRTDHAVFSIGDRSSQYFLKTLNRFKVITAMKSGELKYPTVKALRNHFINWEDTSQKSFGIPNEEFIVDRPFQFGISANAHGRIIGFFIEHVFYIVWFDPDHHTYS